MQSGETVRSNLRIGIDFLINLQMIGSFMDQLLLPKDVVARARIDRNTLRHVLHSSKRLGLPDGGQGRHRRLSVNQAVRASFAAGLVKLGVPLPSAVKVVLKYEGIWRAATSDQSIYLFEATPGNPWRARVIRDGRKLYVQVCRDKPDRRCNAELCDVDFDDFWSVDDWKRVKLAVEIPGHLMITEWNLTHLAMALAAERGPLLRRRARTSRGMTKSGASSGEGRL
jgi:hypothetical protein